MFGAFHAVHPGRGAGARTGTVVSLAVSLLLGVALLGEADGELLAPAPTCRGRLMFDERLATVVQHGGAASRWSDG